jgi:hypothetical protein
MLQKSGRLVLWEAMFILELHSAETQDFYTMKPSRIVVSSSERAASAEVALSRS